MCPCFPLTLLFENSGSEYDTCRHTLTYRGVITACGAEYSHVLCRLVAQDGQAVPHGATSAMSAQQPAPVVKQRMAPDGELCCAAKKHT